jgi:hypothetical protein
MTLTATMTAVEHYTALAQQAADQAADRAYERRERAAARVTFDDVLEQLAALPEATKARMMELYDGGARGDRDHFAWKLVALFVDGLEAATDEYLKGN